MNYDQYIAKWNNKQVMQYGGECVAGIAEFEAENNRPIVWGDAHTWINNPIMLSVYDWIANNPNDPNQLPNRGDIVVWPLPNEHIAFFDQNLGNHQFMSFGQNSGGPAMHFQPHSWANVAGWYTLKQAPAPPPAPVKPYSVEVITPKQVKVHPGAHKWGMNYDNFTAMNDHPEGTADDNTIVTVTAICRHNIGYGYYLESADVPSGWNMLDCDDYTPPPPPPPEPAPAPSAPPAGPLTAPNTEQYDLIVDVRGYASSNQAVNHEAGKDKVTVPEDIYFIYNKRFDANNNIIALNLTRTPGTPGAWINPLDNVPALPPPTPAEIAEAAQKAAEETAAQVAADLPNFSYTYHAFQTPELYVAMRDLPVVDLTGKRKTAYMKKYDITWIVGTFEVNGIDYALPASAEEKSWWYGIEWTDRQTNTPNLELESEIFDGKTTLEDRKATKTLSTSDRLLLVIAHLRNFALGFVHFFAKIKPRS